VLVQIYGITTAEDASAVNALAPDNVGVVLDADVDTWASVSDAVIPGLVRELTNVRVVALSLSTDPNRILRTVDTIQPAILHLARAADGVPLDQIERLRDRIRPVEMMITVPVRDESSLETARRLETVADFLLLDTADAKSGTVGATGIAHDWGLSARIVSQVSVPVVLAGGLGPRNVVDAIDLVGPAGVDSETHTSRKEDRRRKDLDLVVEFIRLARSRGETR